MPRLSLLPVVIVAVIAFGCDAMFAGQNGAPSNDAAVAGDNPSTQNALSDDNECTGLVSDVTVENIIIPEGAECILEGTHVEEDVEIKSWGSLVATNVRIGGNIQAAESQFITVDGESFVGGNVQADNVGTVSVSGASVVEGNIQLKQGGSVDLSDVRIDGDLQLDQNSGSLDVAGNRVRGNMQIFENVGGVTLLGNVVAENLQCKENTPHPTGQGNEAGSKEDQCEAL